MPRKRLRFGCLPWIALLLVVAAGWWFSQTPSHDRVWADDVAQLLEARVDGNTVHLNNVRNFRWRSEDDYTVSWESRDYPLDQLQSADLILSYWMGPHIAHTLVSFGFTDGRYLTFSLEIRKESHEQFSAWKGFFRQYEQVLVAAEESDIIRTRSNARGEDVYIYRVQLDQPALQRLFLAYVEKAQELQQTPEFYNTLTSNCTTVIYELAKVIVPLPMDYRLLASGHVAKYVQEQNGLTPNVPYETLQQAGYINERALQADITGEDFSSAIRKGVPGIQQ